MGDLIDVGCGTGEHTILAAECGAQVLGAVGELHRPGAKGPRLDESTESRYLNRPGGSNDVTTIEASFSTGFVHPLSIAPPTLPVQLHPRRVCTPGRRTSFWSGAQKTGERAAMRKPSPGPDLLDQPERTIIRTGTPALALHPTSGHLSMTWFWAPSTRSSRTNRRKWRVSSPISCSR